MPHDGNRVILCADDFALTAGVSRGILELAAAGRLSATSAMVTFPAWQGNAPALAAVRDRIAVGLHLDLTLGPPLGPMPRLAPAGVPPPVGRLARMALLGRTDPAEIEAETLRQIDRFIEAVGHPPDHVDGHQHAHALPGVRRGVLAALARRFGGAAQRPLVRDPADRPAAILGRRAEPAKALVVAGLAAGFGRAARRGGLVTNRGFSGFSAFDTRRDFAGELDAAMRQPGPLHIVMCHPGHADAELAALDPVTTRREQELAAIQAMPGLPERIWHPRRAVGGPPVDWAAESMSAADAR